MGTRWLLGGVLGLLMAVPPARAGLYFPGKAAPWPLPTYSDQFLRLLNTVRDRAAALENAERLENQRKKGALSINESIALGGYYILARDKTDRALAVLTEALPREPKNFMLLANLANAYQLMREYPRAADYQRQVLRNWPARLEGWNAEQLWWYHRVETYTLNLLRLRERERLLNKPDNTIDELFPVASFNDPAAAYRAGEIALATRNRLAPDVLPLVEQMLLWMPYDNRLYWFYGELLNARGDVRAVRAAYHIFDTLINTERFDSQVLMKHRRILRAAIESDPRFKKQEEKAEVAESFPVSATTGDTGQKGWMPDWRQLGVGFGSGLLVGVLLLLQIRQLRRRVPGSYPAPSRAAHSEAARDH